MWREPPTSFLRGLPGLPACSESLLLHVLDQEIECPFQDGGQVPIRHPVPEQVLRLPQLVPKCPACGELDFERLLRQRCDDRAPRERSARRRPRDCWPCPARVGRAVRIHHLYTPGTTGKNPPY